MRWSISVLPSVYGVAATLLPTADRLARALQPLADGARDGDGLSDESDGALDDDDSDDEDEAACAARARRRASARAARAAARPPLAAGLAVDARDLVTLHGGAGTRGPEAEAASPDTPPVTSATPLLPQPAAAATPTTDAAADAVADPADAAADAGGRVVSRALTLTVAAAELVVVVGPVGCGKSTLLEALARARPLGGGALAVSGRRALVSQKPFLLNGSVRANVVFGARGPLDAPAYADALERAALHADLRALPAGDATIVGEAGVQLSGGQRARVSLARALYSRAAVVFLDDVLAAVDAHTGRWLWERAIVHLARERGVAVVLATHQLQWLPRRDVGRVAVLSSTGALLACAPYATLVARAAAPHAEEAAATTAALRALVGYAQDGAQAAAADEAAADLAAAAQRAPAAASAADDAAAAAAVSPAAASDADDEDDEASMLPLAACARLVATALAAHDGRRVDAAVRASVLAALAPPRGDVRARESDAAADSASADAATAEGATSERVREGLIGWTDFQFYLRHFGSAPTVALLASAAVGAAALGVASNVALARWTDANSACALARAAGAPDAAACAPAVQRAALGGYLALGAGAQVAVCVQALLLAACALRASARLHASVLAALLAAPLSFFDGSTSGAILNRLLQDVQNVT
jgi:ABC-type nitrate/sulfonate/bicarbonate transport system ATPase subunit